ncbi:hypothetical protein CEF21_03960 [Bacillus sp. FJAT-42376]|uniref:HelD family protein n=1 Tax=Bacillus sp. FJAT-42376 TaxID=2014076 RepID=UPI000F4F1618|nr:3'-5' exonuclease [Bacillus sp. FJAT-42376]AZB41518.1 hypothetical protein CEF21_03960 [Bacillus sp. FJAT-42376]
MNKEDLKAEQNVLDETIKHIKNQSYFIWELLEKKREQFSNRDNSPGDEIVYRRGTKDRALLRNAEKEPYFGRIDIIADDNEIETYYIGKQGIRDRAENVIVVDWRMPLASVFYNFIPGHSKQSYFVGEEKNKNKQTVEVLKKKEFTISNQKLLRIVQQMSDTQSALNYTLSESGEEISIKDAFLKEIIQNSETTGYLKEIIATIQREQDVAIRQPINKDVIIQGVAGSGKSSIALHRLSYLLFNNKHINPKDIIILGPSNLFISSVKELLPELNLNGIKQSTVHHLILEFIKPYLNKPVNLSYQEYFESILSKDKNTNQQKLIEFKGSKKFANILETFVEDLKIQYFNRIKPIVLLQEIMDTESLIKIFEGYKYLSFTNQIQRFLRHVENHFERVAEEKINELKKQYEFISRSYLQDAGLDPFEFKQLNKRMKEIYDFKAGKVREEFKTVISEWKESHKAPSLLNIYNQVTSYEILKMFGKEIERDIPELFKENKLSEITYFDIAPLFYIYLLIYDRPVVFAHMVIDEAQDLSYVHFAALKKITKTMTILGDTDQSLFMGYGQCDWTGISKSLLNIEKDYLLNLDTSYRSTREIVEAANKVLQNHFGSEHKKVVPLNRSGEAIEYTKVESGKQLVDGIITTIKSWKRKYKRIAIIHKDEQKAKKLAEILSKEYNRDVTYVSPDQEVNNKAITVLASYYTKGMEFDAVVLVNVNDSSFPKNDFNAKLLYVMFTRAQQKAKVFYQGEPSLLLEGLIEKIPQYSSVFDDIL